MKQYLIGKMTTYRLPDGKYTKSANVYIRTWRKLGRKMLKLLPGWSLNGWDPTFEFVKWEKVPNSPGFHRATDRLEMSVQAIETIISSIGVGVDETIEKCIKSFFIER